MEFNSNINESIYNLYFQEDEILRFCLEYTKCNICLADINTYMNNFNISYDFKVLFEVVIIEYRNLLVTKLTSKLKITSNELDIFIEQNYNILTHVDSKRLDFIYLYFLYNCCAKLVNEIFMQTTAYEDNIGIYHSYEDFIHISTVSVLSTLPFTLKITSFLLTNYLNEVELQLLFTSILSNEYITLLLSNNAINIGKLLPIKIVKLNDK